MIVSKHISNDPHRIQLRASVQSARPGAVDLKTGRISGVSLLTADREATGWDLWIDAKTLDTFHALLSGRRLKAYATHGSDSLDGTLDEIGFWENARIDGGNLRADFTALDAWRRHAPAEFDTLFELAEKMSAEFGASLGFSYEPVWVLQAGREIATQRKESISGAVTYDPPAPAGALRAMPSVRALEVYCADFVDTPAANSGLFSAAKYAGSPALYGLARTRAAFAAKLALGSGRADKSASAPPKSTPSHGPLFGMARTRAAFAAQLEAARQANQR